MEEHENTEGGGRVGGIIFLIAALLTLPLAALTVIIARLAHTKGRIHPSVIAAFAGIYWVILLATGLVLVFGNLYGQSFSMLFQGINEGSLTAGLVAGVLVRQLPLGLGIGAAIGSVLIWLNHRRRNEWERITYRITPWQWLRKRRHIEQLRTGANPPANGATLGINELGEKVIQTDEEAASHTFIVGASGAGKTTTMMRQAVDHIRRGHGYVFIDLKGGRDVPAALYAHAQEHQRPFYHFLIQDAQEPYTGPDPDGASFYDPLGRGDASRRKDMLIAGRKWSEDYYKTLASSYLQTAFNVAIAVPPQEGTDSLSDIISLLTPSNLAARAASLPAGEHYDEVRDYVRDWTARKLDRGEQSAIDGMKRELQVLRGSSAGQWLRHPKGQGKSINLKQVAREGGVVVFSLDSSNYEQTAAAVANFIVQDLKTVSSELRLDPAAKPLHIVIDEFAAMDSSNVINLINKARDAKMPVSLSTQALGDLKKVDTAFLEQLLGIINCFIIHRANMEDDLTVYAGLTGKTERWKARYGVEHSSGLGFTTGIATGSGSVEQVEDYRVSPKELQELKRGEAIYVAMSPEQRFERVQVIPYEGIVATEPDVVPPVVESYIDTPEEVEAVDASVAAMPSLDPENLPPVSEPESELVDSDAFWAEEEVDGHPRVSSITPPPEHEPEPEPEPEVQEPQPVYVGTSSEDDDEDW